MSYPRAIQPLVIEDEAGPKSYYEAVFERLQKAGLEIDPPHFAFCYEQGLEALRSSTIYHLVILDLQLPLKPQEPAPDSLSFGQNLLESCASRNGFPVPAVLVISGHLDQADQTDLEARVTRGFAYGRVLTKGTKLEAEIERAIHRIHCYCDIGVHVRDGGTAEYPAIAPREEDLLRRAAMEQGLCGGLDLQWWADEYAPATTANDPYAGWTKTFMGSWILSRGRGRSRPLFFKLAPAEGADSVAAEAKLLETKLPHVKVAGAWSSGDRSLLITEKVGEDDSAPISLVEFLGGAKEPTQRALPDVISAVAGQLARLGERRPDQIPVAKLLWTHHDAERLRTQWVRWARLSGNAARGLTSSDPLSLFAKLKAATGLIAVQWQSALHGDLNVTNIALDVTSVVRGYIFDASGTSAGVDVRDLAMLEVTALLHQPFRDDEDVLDACKEFYVSPDIAAQGAALPTSDRVANTIALIEVIRGLPAVASQPEVYAMTLFDHALIQLAGLGFTVSRNKVHRPEDAAAVCMLTAHRVQNLASHLLATDPASG